MIQSYQRIGELLTEWEQHQNSKLQSEICAEYEIFTEKIKIFLISRRDIYYGYFMIQLKFELVFNEPCIAGIRLNTYPQTFVANPTLLFCYTLKEILYIFCHEIEHLLLDHPSKMIEANPKKNADLFRKLNLAADASVNDRLDYEIMYENKDFMKRPVDAVTSATIKSMFKLANVHKLESYLYYFNLIKNLNSDDYVSFGHKSMGKSNKAIIHHQWSLENEYDDVSRSVKEFVNRSLALMDEETRRLMPAHFSKDIDNLNGYAQLSWNKLLKKYVGTLSDERIKTSRRLNRRQPKRFDIKGSVMNTTLKIVVAVDTSASVSNNQLKQIFQEIFEILSNKRYEMTVIECDSIIQNIYQVKNISDLQLKVKGRGGTAFTPVIEYINQNRLYSDALLIYFTDGYGEDTIPKPKTYRNLWVVLNENGYLSLQESYGAVVNIKD